MYNYRFNNENLIKMKLDKGTIASELQLLIDGVNSKQQTVEEIAAYVRWRDKQFTTPDVMPRSLTAENGAKSLLNGEFFETVEIPNEEYCGCGECDYCHDFPETEETITIKVPVTWTTIKEIYARIVAHYGT